MTTRKNERELTVALTSRDRGYEAGFKAAQRATRNLDRETREASQGGIRQMNSSLDVATQRIKTFVGVVAAAAVGRALVGWAHDVKDSAVNLNESINAVNVAAGDGAAKILQFGENAATSVGLAQSAFNGAVVPLVSQLQNFGFSAGEAADAAIVLTQRAADLASVFNTDVDEALGAIQAALRGESDPIEKFGGSISAARVEALLLNEGLVSSKSAITDADKVMGRYLLLLEDTDRVQGDFANTSDELANRTRIFQARLEDWKAEVGQSVIPIFEELLGIGEDLIPTLQTLGEDVVPKIANAFINFIEGVRRIVEFFTDLPAAVQIAGAALATFEVSLIAIESNPVIVGLALVAAGVAAIGAAARDNRDDVEALRSSLEDTVNPGLDLLTLQQVIGPKDVERLHQAGVELDTVKRLLLEGRFNDENFLTRFGQDLKTQGVEGVGELIGALRHLQDQFDDVRPSIERSDLGGTIARIIGNLAEGIDPTNVTGAIDRYRGLADTVATTITNVVEGGRGLAGVISSYHDWAQAVTDTADAYTSQLSGALTNYLDIFTNAPKLADTTVGIDQIIANAETRIDRITAFASGLQRLQDEGLFNLAIEFRDQGPQSLADLQAFVADLDAGGSKAFTLDQTLGQANTVIDDLATQLGDDFARAKTPLLTQASEFGSEFADSLAAGFADQSIQFALSLAGVTVKPRPEYTFTGPAGIEGRAGGGSVIPGRPYFVGENGIELFTPDTAGSITPTSGLGGTTINATYAPVINAAGASADALARATVREFSAEIKKYDAGGYRPQ